LVETAGSEARTIQLLGYAPTMDSGMAAIIGASVSAGVALATQVLTSSLSTRASKRREFSGRLTRYLGGTRSLMLAVEQVALAEFSDKAKVEAEHLWAYRDSTAAALTEIELHDQSSIVTAVMSVDEAVQGLISDARGRVFTRVEWSTHRTSTLDAPLSKIQGLGRELAS
jgi:hypothetical protein